MDIIGYAAKNFAQLQWAQAHPKEQLLLENPYRGDEPFDFETERGTWLDERRLLWMQRLDRIGKAMSTAETLTCFWCVIILISKGNMDSYCFSRWFDLAAIPLLIGMDSLHAYSCKDRGRALKGIDFAISNIVVLTAGALCGFLLPFLIISSFILLFILVPYMARSVIKTFRYM